MTEVLRLSNSKSNTFRRCQKQFEFKYVYKIRPRRVKMPLRLGDWLHQLLMVHYDGWPWRERHAILTADFEKLLDEERVEIGDLPTNAERLMKGYLAHYREEDKRYRVVDSEINEIVELPNGMMAQIIIDLIVEDLTDHALWVMDHKWVSRFFPEEFMLLDSQLALYFWGANKLGYHGLRGAMLNEGITKPPTLPKWLEPSQRFEQRKNLHCDAYTYYAQIKAAGQDPKDYAAFLRMLRGRHDQWWRRTRLPRDKAMISQVVNEMMATGRDIERVTARGRFTRTARKECQFDCDYLSLCIAQLQGANLDHMIKIQYEPSTKPDEEEILRLWPGSLKR